MNLAAEYPYAGLPLTPSVMADLIPSLCLGEMLQRSEIIDRCTKHHVINGGAAPSGGSAVSATKKALNTLTEAGRVEPAGVPGFWRVGEPTIGSIDRLVANEPSAEGVEPSPSSLDPSVVHGDGPEAVYAYSFPAYVQLARLDGDSRHPIKIGMTAGDVEARIASQVGTGLPEPPSLLLVLRVESARLVERILHDVLTLRGQQIATAPGAEWFTTTIDELLEINRWLQDSGPVAGPPQDTVSEVPSL